MSDGFDAVAEAPVAKAARVNIDQGYGVMGNTLIHHGHHAGAGQQHAGVHHGHNPITPPKPVLTPTFNTVVEYKLAIDHKITAAKTRWTNYAWRLSEAYARAYHEQEEALQHVKKNIDARKKEEEALLTMALNALTVGVGGALAGACVKKLISTGAKAGAEGLENAVKETLKETLTEGARDAGKDLLKDAAKKYGSERLGKYLVGEASEDPFKPPVMNPDRYIAQAHDSFTALAQTLDDLIVALDNLQLSREEYGVVAPIILAHPILTSPPHDLSKEAMYRRTALSMWIAWGWGRDVPYWRHTDRVYTEFDRNYESANDMKPVYEALTKLGVQLFFTQKKVSLYGTIPNPINDFQGPELVKGAEDIIDMEAFINWSKNPATWFLVFGILPTQIGEFKRSMAGIKGGA
jgi:hypothetical protein